MRSPTKAVALFALVTLFLLALIPPAHSELTWRYRLPIEVASDADVGETAVNLTLDISSIASHIKYADGSDIYFTDADGNPLHYWIEELNLSNGVLKAWVRTNLTAEFTRIYMYYGGSNPYSSYRDPAGVFDFFDNLNDTSAWTLEAPDNSGSGDSASATFDTSTYYSPPQSIKLNESHSVTSDSGVQARAYRSLPELRGDYVFMFMRKRSNGGWSNFDKYYYLRVVVNGTVIYQSNAVCDWSRAVTEAVPLNGSATIEFQLYCSGYSTSTIYSGSTTERFDDVAAYKYYDTVYIKVYPEEQPAIQAFFDFYVSEVGHVIEYDQSTETITHYLGNATVPLLLKNMSGFSIYIYRDFVKVSEGVVPSDEYAVNVPMYSRVSITVSATDKVVYMTYMPYQALTVPQLTTAAPAVSVEANVTGGVPPTIAQLSKLEIVRFGMPILALGLVLLGGRRWAWASAAAAIGVCFMTNWIFGFDVVSTTALGVAAFVAVFMLFARE